jgi:hypothetical protein
MHAKPAALVQSAGMGEDVAAAGFIDVEANHLLADRTLGGDRVKPTSAQEFDAQELDELDDPYRDVPHVASSQSPNKEIPASERNYDGASGPAGRSAEPWASPCPLIRPIN